VAGVTFSDSDSAPVSKFLNPGLAIFQIWESDSCSDCGCNHRFNRNLPMFDLKNDHTHSCYCRNWKVTPDPGPFFPKFLTTGPDPGPKEKRRILPESTPDGPTSSKHIIVMMNDHEIFYLPNLLCKCCRPRIFWRILAGKSHQGKVSPTFSMYARLVIKFHGWIGNKNIFWGLYHNIALANTYMKWCKSR